jgi:hypothetical protein
MTSELLVDPIDLYQASRRKSLEVANTHVEDPITGSAIDLGWLQFAAKEYNISPDIHDYLLVPVIIAPANLPNRNGMGFALEDLPLFSVEHGCQYYKTWRGKPTFYEHQHDDPTKANGVILDVFLRKSERGDFWKIINYMAFDRSKHTDLIRRVENKEVTTYSMGAFITGGYTCSYCGRKYGNCKHISKQRPNEINLIETKNGPSELAYRVAHKPVGFETSIVETPAYAIASNDQVDYL